MLNYGKARKSWSNHVKPYYQMCFLPICYDSIGAEFNWGVAGSGTCDLWRGLRWKGGHPEHGDAGRFGRFRLMSVKSSWFWDVLSTNFSSLLNPRRLCHRFFPGVQESLQWPIGFKWFLSLFSSFDTTWRMQLRSLGRVKFLTFCYSKSI